MRNSCWNLNLRQSQFLSEIILSNLFLLEDFMVDFQISIVGSQTDEKLFFSDISLLNERKIYGAQLKKYTNEAIFLSANDLILLLNGKKNDLWRLSFFYVRYFLCLFLTHLILFHIFFLLLLQEEKSFSLDFRFSRSTTLLHLYEEINIWAELFDEKKGRKINLNQTTEASKHEEKLILRNCERFIWSRNFSSNHAIFHNHQSF